MPVAVSHPSVAGRGPEVRSQSQRRPPPPFKLRAFVTPEDSLHQAVSDALRVLLPTDAVWTTWELRNASSAAEGARRKRLGARAGWPDLGIFWHGRACFLELKRERGWQLSPAQKQLHAQLSASGFRVHVAHSVEEALAAVTVAGIPIRGRIAA